LEKEGRPYTGGSASAEFGHLYEALSPAERKRYEDMATSK